MPPPSKSTATVTTWPSMSPSPSAAPWSAWPLTAATVPSALSPSPQAVLPIVSPRSAARAARHAPAASAQSPPPPITAAAAAAAAAFSAAASFSSPPPSAAPASPPPPAIPRVHNSLSSAARYSEILSRAAASFSTAFLRWSSRSRAAREPRATLHLVQTRRRRVGPVIVGGGGLGPRKHLGRHRVLLQFVPHIRGRLPSLRVERERRVKSRRARRSRPENPRSSPRDPPA